MSAYDLSLSDRVTYRRYADLALPRHTSYPISPAWRREYGAPEFRGDLAQTANENRPLSLYVHVPFCAKLCYYCACTKEIVPLEKRLRDDPAESFLDALAAEADRIAELVGRNPVHQIHWGGGSPTFLDPGQLRRLWHILEHRFLIAPGAEIAVEIDPRITSREHLVALRETGFNRISLGIQDFSPSVQKAVNRVQPVEVVERVVAWCRELGFESINFDLIYGLPFQTPASLVETLERTIELGPDRIAFYRLAVIPDIFRWQKTFSLGDLPAGEESLELNLLAINRFLGAGYEFIGLDHFARPDEALAKAQKRGELQRSFQGMTTGKGLDLIGLGPSAISMLDHAYAQNVKTSGPWASALVDDLAVERGLRLSLDDRLRREVLQQLYGQGVIDKSHFEVSFDEYFADELVHLRELANEGLVKLDAESIRLTAPLGRLLVRVVAAVFDAYLPPKSYREGLPLNLASKVG